MHVHIVSSDFEKENILGRLVRSLIKDTGWSVDSRPDPSAELNYMFPYLEWARHRNFNSTLVAAWFSHYDVGRTSKEIEWKEAAERADLRITSAAMYREGLAAYGQTVLATTPLDLEHFHPAAKPRTRRRKRVGTGGFVYPGGRKGEALIARLMQSPLGKRIDLIASGKGWPCETKLVEWSKMPAFYQSLDVYVCTSLIEGIGYGPLEAMACGIPVVIPREVGVFDELPDLQNVFRYERGDYESMELALSEALDEPVNRLSLRGAAERFTDEAWMSAHTQAIEGLLMNVPPIPADLPDWQGKSGVFYVAYGKQARECAQRAMVALRDRMPGLPICLVSDQAIGLEDVFVQHPDTDVGARSVKTQIYDLAPAEWEYVLYLDADTEVVEDIGFLFQLLQDGWEFVICTNPAQYVLAREMRRPDNLDEMEETIAQLGTDEILQYNGGVFAFRRNDRTAHLIRSWYDEWNRYGKRDQAALDRALYAQPVRVYTLGKAFNCITRYDKTDGCAILHYPMTARRWKGRLNGRLDSDESWAALHPTQLPANKPKSRRRTK